MTSKGTAPVQVIRSSSVPAGLAYSVTARRVVRDVGRLAGIAGLVLFGLGSPAVLAASWGVDYSAEMVLTNPDNASQQKTARYYSSEGRTRRESTIPKSRAQKQGMGKHQVEITNPYKGGTWLVFPDVRKYYERTFEVQTEVPAPLAPGDAKHPCQADDKIKCKKLGNESLAGRATEKWEIVSDGPDGSITTTVWLDTEIGVPVRELIPGKLMRELRDIKTGSLDDSLFLPPAGFEKLEAPAK